MDYSEIINDLYEWKYDELASGSRIKASIINKVEERIRARRQIWYNKNAVAFFGDEY